MTHLEDVLNEAALNKCIEQRDKAEKYNEQLKTMLASASDRADEQQKRAEAAEARAAANDALLIEAAQTIAELREQRHAAWTELRATSDEVSRLFLMLKAKRDAVKLELRRILTMLDDDDRDE